ncbi:hypothetical protein [Marvinbryantia formatexigens]|nr:hypothetical protein [Marvinbryantia formatexigens]UWO26474.1 hypothetical protein NQ534_08470 [Marvinbryantia formatexigens DSM 14469]
MHFEGSDQRHGFTKRIAGDITNPECGGIQRVVSEMGDYYMTTGEMGAPMVIGGGMAPPLGYDYYVVQNALAYLRESHERLQCMVVGTYAPHFSYYNYKKAPAAALRSRIAEEYTRQFLSRKS